MEVISLPVVAVWLVASIALQFVCSKFLFKGNVGLK